MERRQAVSQASAILATSPPGTRSAREDRPSAKASGPRRAWIFIDPETYFTIYPLLARDDIALAIDRTDSLSWNNALATVRRAFGPLRGELMVVGDGVPAGFIYLLLGVTSDEPETGCGSGDQTPDIQGVEVGQPDVEFEVRAERCGTGDGRTYTAVYEALDPSGNSTTVSAVIIVPHDKR